MHCTMIHQIRWFIWISLFFIFAFGFWTWAVQIWWGPRGCAWPWWTCIRGCAYVRDGRAFKKHGLVCVANLNCISLFAFGSPLLLKLLLIVVTHPWNQDVIILMAKPHLRIMCYPWEVPQGKKTCLISSLFHFQNRMRNMAIVVSKNILTTSIPHTWPFG